MSENIHGPNLREICTCSIQQFIGGTLAELAEEKLGVYLLGGHLGFTKSDMEKKEVGMDPWP